MSPLTRKIKDAIAAGETCPSKISKALGCAQFTVYRVAQQCGLTVSLERARPVSDRIESQSYLVLEKGKRFLHEYLYVPRPVLRKAFGNSDKRRNFVFTAEDGRIVITPGGEK